MAIRIPKSILFWCPNCDIPILKSSNCGNCGKQTETVKCTPPYEFRPGFPIELDFIRGLCDENFGEGTGKVLFPEEAVVLINDIPGIDRFEEIVVQGQCVAALRYDIGEGYKFLIKVEGARKIAPHLTRSYVVIEDDAVPFILKKASTLRPGVVDFDPGIRKGQDCVVVDSQRKVISVGTAMMEGGDIGAAKRGVVVKTRSVASADEDNAPLVPELQTPPPSWETAVAANRKRLEGLQEEAVGFVKRMVEKNQKLPVSVSFSGGKDSLATLLLVLKADLKPEVVFINTGLEFPETLDYVKVVSRHYDLPLLEAETKSDFWSCLHYFGPPGKDYRWCCKTQKLGPVSRFFAEHYPDGVLSFIGQRRFESKEREKKGRVWKNPWVPLQLGSSPIQNWNSLEVWLYLFREKAPINVWYQRGLARIGCWLCPSSDQGDMSFVQEFYREGFDRLQVELQNYAREKGFSREWVRYGLWRWKTAPLFIKGKPELEQAVRRSSSGDPVVQGEKRISRTVLEFQPQGGLPSPNGGFILKGCFSGSFELEQVEQLFSILGDVEKEGDQLTIRRKDKSIVILPDGSIQAKAEDPKVAARMVDTLRKIIIKAADCLYCGICISSCQNHALFFEDGLKVKADSCTHCLTCISPCPVVDYKDRR